MKVIGAGFGRTGTLSLKAALEQLGFAPCLHMVDVIRESPRVEQWRAAVAGRPVDWRALFDGYEATVDWPGCTFYAELMTAFPEAKVVLTVRDPDELGGGTQPAPSSEVMDMITTLIWDGSFGGRFDDRAHAIDVFERHNAAVQSTVPADRLLVHEIGEGWEPLVDFLGVERPDTPFPRLNDTAAFREMVGIPAP